MINKPQALLDGYYRWLRKQTALREFKDWTEITTPYPDRHNDCLQIYVRRVNGGFELTDDGHIIEDLEHSGCNIYKTSKRRSLFKTTLNGFGVQDDRKALKVTASENNFALRKHNLVQAMLAVNDLFYLASPITTSLFREDVEAWLNSSSIRYEPRMELKGKSGYNHPFDFTIPKSGCLLRLISHPSRACRRGDGFFLRRHQKEPSSGLPYIRNRERRAPFRLRGSVGRYARTRGAPCTMDKARASTSGVRRVTPPQVTKSVVEQPPPPDRQANKHTT